MRETLAVAALVLELDYRYSHERVSLFFEVRWCFVWGNVYGLPGSSRSRGSASYFPLTLGVRF